jgi:hypothetical protein
VTSTLASERAVRSISVRSSVIAGLSPTNWDSDVAVIIECLDSGPVDAVLIWLDPSGRRPGTIACQRGGSMGLSAKEGPLIFYGSVSI